MQSQNLLQTKLLSPQQGHHHIARPRLTRYLNKNLDKQLILITAPAGYGKTTLLIEVASQIKHLVWYQLDNNDSDPNVFISYLTEGIRQKCNQKDSNNFGKTVLSLLYNDEEKISSTQIITVLINEITETISDDLFIVLDDYHLLSNAAIHGMLNFLIQNTPHNIHFIISSRTTPPLSLPRLRAYGQLLEITTDELRFTHQEISSWAGKNYYNINSGDLEKLGDQTEGWAAALQIFFSQPKQEWFNQDTIFPIKNNNRSQSVIFRYLAEEVFQRQSESIQQFLLQSSILTQMDEKVCEILPDTQKPRDILTFLESQNLFIFRLDDQGHWYRYHPLFREFLLNKLDAEQPALRIELERLVGQFYESQKIFELAFSHYCHAKKFINAIEILKTLAPILSQQGRFKSLLQSFNQIPPEMIIEYPVLLLEKGNALKHLGNLGQAITCFEDAQKRYETDKEVSGVCQSLTHLAKIYHSQGNYRKAEGFATRSFEIAPDEDHIQRTEALMAMARCSGLIHNMDASLNLAQQAVMEARRIKDKLPPQTFARLLQSIGEISWWYGNPHETKKYCEEALQNLPDELTPTAARAYSLLSTPHLYWRNFDQSLKYAEKSLDISQRLHLMEILPSAYTALGNVLIRMGKPTQAENSLRQALEIANRYRLASYERLMAISYLALNLVGQKRLDEARQLVEEALWSHTGNPNSYEAFVCRSVLADTALESQQIDLAESIFEELLAVGEQQQYRIPLSLVYFGLAYIYFLTDRDESGYSYAKKSLELLESTNAIQLYIDQGERCQFVCEKLISHGLKSPFIYSAFNSLSELSKDGEPAIELINEPDVITIQSLGQFKVFSNSTEITKENWVSYKARDLMAYFVTFRSERITSDKIFDEVWADIESPSKTAFHTALSRLRGALRQNNSSTKFVLVESGNYWLDTPRFRIDVDQFDQLISKAQATPDQLIAKDYNIEAVDLYKGEYLANFYYNWVFPERHRLLKIYMQAIRNLAEYYLAQKDYEQAISYWEKALIADSAQEDIHQRIMVTYAEMGDRVGFIRQYKRLEEILNDQLDIKPSKQTIELYKSLLKS